MTYHEWRANHANEQPLPASSLHVTRNSRNRRRERTHQTVSVMCKHIFFWSECSEVMGETRNCCDTTIVFFRVDWIMMPYQESSKKSILPTEKARELSNIRSWSDFVVINLHGHFLKISVALGDTNDARPLVSPSATEICKMAMKIDDNETTSTTYI